MGRAVKDLPRNDPYDMERFRWPVGPLEWAVFTVIVSTGFWVLVWGVLYG